MRILASSVVWWVIWASVSGMEIPVPSTYSPPEWFSAAAGEEFVVANSQTVVSGDSFSADLFWLRSQAGELQGEPEHQVFEFMIFPPPGPSSSRHYRFSIFYWDRFDHPHFSETTWSSHFDMYYGIYSESTTTVLLTYPTLDFGFVLDRNSSGTDPSGSHSEQVKTDYHITPGGQYVAVERHTIDFTSSYPYYQPSYTLYSTHVVNSNGLNTTYDDIQLNPTVPRYNPYANTFSVLGLAGAIHMRIVEYAFSDSITSSSIYTSTGLLSDLDFQPDPQGRLHLIWDEADTGLQYAVYDGEVLSTPILLADSAAYQFPFALRTNEVGDLYLFNLSTDMRPTLWTRYHTHTGWTMQQLAPIAEEFDQIDGVINDQGGLSFLAYSSTVPDPALLWHSDTREGPLNLHLLRDRNTAQILQHSFTATGNVGLLVEKTDGSYAIVTNLQFSQLLSTGGRWVLYP